MTMFNKRHYETIALIMQGVCPETSEQYDLWNMMRSRLATVFEQDNRLFKRDRFIQACVPGRNVNNSKPLPLIYQDYLFPLDYLD